MCSMDTKIVIGICTRNRPVSLQLTLQSIKKAKVENLQIIICDSSHGDIFDLNKQVIYELFKGSGIHLKSPPGLALQRNKILEKIREKFEYIYFLDDDVEIDEDYYDKLNNIFRSQKDIGIIGAKIRNIPSPLFPLRKQGKVLKSGKCVGIYNLKGDNYVDWTPGLSLSIRLSSITNLHFDERRKGNSIGEDADFCLKAGKQTKILWTDKTSLKHHVDPIGRDHVKKYVYASNYHRYLLKVDFPDKVNRINIIASNLGDTLVSFVLLFIRKDKKYYHIAINHISFLFFSYLYFRNLEAISDRIDKM